MSAKFTLRSRVEAAKAQNGFTYTNFVHRDDLIPLNQVKDAIREYMLHYGVHIPPSQIQQAIQSYFNDQGIQTIDERIQSYMDQHPTLSPNPKWSYWQHSMYREYGSSRVELKNTFKAVPGATFFVEESHHESRWRFVGRISVRDSWSGQLNVRFVGDDDGKTEMSLGNFQVKDDSRNFRIEVSSVSLFDLLGYPLTRDAFINLEFNATNITGSAKVFLENLVMENLPA
jgi:hypothetical protein